MCVFVITLHVMPCVGVCVCMYDVHYETVHWSVRCVCVCVYIDLLVCLCRVAAIPAL